MRPRGRRTSRAGVWHQVAIHVHWSQTATVGYADLWLDGVKTVTMMKGKTKPNADTLFYQTGLHRKNTSANITDVIYFDDFIEGDAEADIKIGAPTVGTPDGGTSTDASGAAGTGGSCKAPARRCGDGRHPGSGRGRHLGHRRNVGRHGHRGHERHGPPRAPAPRAPRARAATGTAGTGATGASGTTGSHATHTSGCATGGEGSGALALSGLALAILGRLRLRSRRRRRRGPDAKNDNTRTSLVASRIASQIASRLGARRRARGARAAGARARGGRLDGDIREERPVRSGRPPPTERRPCRTAWCGRTSSRAPSTCTRASTPARSRSTRTTSSGSAVQGTAPTSSTTAR